MRTRVARYEDVHAVVRYLRQNHDNTGWGCLPINDKVLRESVVALIRTHDVADVLVAEDSEGVIRGVLLATLDRFFWCKKFYASSVHFVATGGGAALVNAFKHWAATRNCECIIEAVATDDARAEAFMEATGFERRGGALVCWLRQAEERAA